MYKKQAKYLNYFNNLSKNNFYKTNCLCEPSAKSFTIAKRDLFNFKFDFVICRQCGLIRAKNFLKPDKLVDFYSNHYTHIFSDDYLEPKEYFNFQNKYSESRWHIIHLVKEKINKNDIILDLGGCTGGTLSRYIDQCECIVADYDEKFLEYARFKKIKTIYGGIDQVIELNIKPTLIILSHVVEHIVDLDNFYKKLKKISNKKTYIYIEFPALDSLRLGRAKNFKNELHIPHIYYFTSYWMENYLNLNGFKCDYVDKYSCIVASLDTDNFYKKKYNFKIKNYFKKVIFDIFLGNIRDKFKDNSFVMKLVDYLNKRKFMF